MQKHYGTIGLLCERFAEQFKECLNQNFTEDEVKILGSNFSKGKGQLEREVFYFAIFPKDAKFLSPVFTGKWGVNTQPLVYIESQEVTLEKSSVVVSFNEDAHVEKKAMRLLQEMGVEFEDSSTSAVKNVWGKPLQDYSEAHQMKIHVLDTMLRLPKYKNVPKTETKIDGFLKQTSIKDVETWSNSQGEFEKWATSKLKRKSKLPVGKLFDLKLTGISGETLAKFYKSEHQD